MALSVLDRDIELAEHEFLKEALIDDEENDDGKLMMTTTSLTHNLS